MIPHPLSHSQHPTTHRRHTSRGANPHLDHGLGRRIYISLYQSSTMGSNPTPFPITKTLPSPTCMHTRMRIHHRTQRYPNSMLLTTRPSEIRGSLIITQHTHNNIPQSPHHPKGVFKGTEQASRINPTTSVHSPLHFLKVPDSSLTHLHITHHRQHA